MPRTDPVLFSREPSTKSPLMATALVAGETVHAFLAEATLAHVPAAEHARVERDVSRWAARGSYAGLALWTIGALTERPRLRAFGEALAGVSIGMMKRGAGARQN